MKFIANTLSLIFLIGSALSIWGVKQVNTFESWLLLAVMVSGLCFFIQLSRMIRLRTSQVVSFANQPSLLDRISPITDFGASIFGVLFIVFVLRSFLYEPFRIPSGSMIPTLHIGDFVLVNKFQYGVRLPVLGWHVFGENKVQRGDVAVFRFPDDPSIDYIKRIIGLPGDTIQLQGEQIFINGEPVSRQLLGSYAGSQKSYVGASANEFTESISDQSFQVLWFKSNFFATQSVTFTIPEDSYFVMGDNRNNSNDSRFWGFVPEHYLKGKAFLIWLNWHNSINFDRIGIRI